MSSDTRRGPVTLVQALEIVGRRDRDARAPFSVRLACGFEALHLRTFLTAELLARLPLARVEVHTGLFDDLVGTIADRGRSAVDAIAVVIEWPDIDPRCGFRRLGGWRPSDVADIVEQADRQLARLQRAILDAAGPVRLVCCLPSLPLPPLFPHAPEQSGADELRLRSAVAAFGARIARHDGVVVCSSQRLDQWSPPAARRDLATELIAGFPYTVAHASHVAVQLAALIASPARKKGLITDLDDTLWTGSVGEVGAGGVSWSGPDGHRHAVYQQLLASLADSGVLIGVASRNDPELVAETLRRPDLLLEPDTMFPVEAHRGPKSAAISRILEIWNVAADAVVFVDDAPLELDEARHALPGLETVRFPADAGTELIPFLERLRATFGTGVLTAEDGLRLRSVRSGEAYRRDARDRARDPDDFLASVGGELAFTGVDGDPARALELINKTHQFNLNGRRWTAAALAAAVAPGPSRLITAAYRDRYGPLGMVAALIVRPGGAQLEIDTWVMSCRAFSRRVEHHCLRYLFDTFDVDEVTTTYRMSARNAPVRDFLSALLGEEPAERVRVTRATFDERAPALVHRIIETGE
ncbi:MAG: HAD-IIIC family phosphatase [Solirubrobacteraceae bacterium]|jgi:FkbH-like protein